MNLPVDLDALDQLAVNACAALSTAPDTVATTWTRTVAQRLAEAAAPILTRRRRPNAAEWRLLRLPALCLAAEATPWDVRVADQFRTLAAGITLLQRRAEGNAPLETILLARE